MEPQLWPLLWSYNFLLGESAHGWLLTQRPKVNSLRVRSGSVERRTTAAPGPYNPVPGLWGGHVQGGSIPMNTLGDLTGKEDMHSCMQAIPCASFVCRAAVGGR